MELTLAAVYHYEAALDIHQAKLTDCILYETDGGDVVAELRELDGFKRDRRVIAE